MSTTSKKRAPRLTKAEDVHYGEQFGYYLRNIRADNKRADNFAWRETRKAFPRLQKYARF